ncbi:hypothetical protein BD311DRAFT_602175, partial [Dichomitus squalens]
PTFAKLDDTNYAEWYTFMQALLTKQGVWGVVSSALGHIHDTTDTHTLWTTLKTVHCSRGFGMHLSLCRDFFSMVRGEYQTMTSWIADVHQLAFQLKDIGATYTTVTDEDIIIVLTKGLPSSYEHLVVSLDATLSDDLTLNLVIRRLVNEESRQ